MRFSSLRDRVSAAPAAGAPVRPTRPVAVAAASIAALTLTGWAALLIEAAREGIASEAALRAICRPTALLAGVPSDPAWQFAASAALWIAMALAMMIPTAAPMALDFAENARIEAEAGRRLASPFFIVAGYATVWIGAALLGAAIQTALSAAAPRLGLPERAAAILAGAAIGAAGLYQFSEAKGVCLSFCRHLVRLDEGRSPQRAAEIFRLGLRQGVACLGCCLGLMALMLAAGAMNLFWMAALSLLMTIEKATAGMAVPRAIGILLVAAGSAVALGAVGLDSVAHWLTSR